MQEKELLSYKELQDNIIGWASEKGLLIKENAPNQYLKFLEEVGETARFLLLKNASDEKLKSKGLTRENVEAEIKDGFGDIAVTVIILAKQLNIKLDNEIYFIEEFDKMVYFVQDVRHDFMPYETLSYIYSVCHNYCYDLQECLNLAWNTIKYRTGKTVNGTFIKD